MRKVIETIPSADGIRTAQAGNVREERVGGQWDRFDADEKRVSKAGCDKQLIGSCTR